VTDTDVAALLERERKHAKAFLLIEAWAERALFEHEHDANIACIFRLAHAIREPSCMHKHPTWLDALDMPGPADD
jgi:hypothetical protein